MERQASKMSTETAPPLSASIEAITSSLPPKTDHATYLTILESHLRPELLPTLHKVLQDRDLTVQIGWDLIGLLVPLLPNSKDGLDWIARMGNPREVILKVLEALRQVEFPDLEDPASVPSDQVLNENFNVNNEGASAIHRDSSQAKDGYPSLHISSKVCLQTDTLLSLLPILHPRIETKYPSRFLSLTLQTVLARYTDTTRLLPSSHVDEITRSIVRHIGALSDKTRPALPPRQSSRDDSSGAPIVPDPEGEINGKATDRRPSKEEFGIQKRLLQSFITHVVEEYLSSINPVNDVPGLAWSVRFQEKAHPEKIVPERPTFSQMFREQALLSDRESIFAQLTVCTRGRSNVS